MAWWKQGESPPDRVLVHDNTDALKGNRFTCMVKCRLPYPVLCCSLAMCTVLCYCHKTLGSIPPLTLSTASWKTRYKRARLIFVLMWNKNLVLMNGKTPTPQMISMLLFCFLLLHCTKQMSKCKTLFWWAREHGNALEDALQNLEGGGGNRWKSDSQGKWGGGGSGLRPFLILPPPWFEYAEQRAASGTLFCATLLLCFLTLHLDHLWGLYFAIKKYKILILHE